VRSPFAVAAVISLLIAGCAAHPAGFTAAGEGKQSTGAPVRAEASRPAQIRVAARDALGYVVRLPGYPRRIVSWAPNATEILFALGLAHRVVGVTRYCDFPPEAKRKPKVGSIIAPSIERTLALKPDLVVAARLNDRRIIDAARRAGLQVFAIDPTSVEQVYGVILSVGHLTDTTQRAKHIVASMRRKIEAARRRSIALGLKRRPKVLFVYQLNPIWTAGRATFPDEIVRLAGGQNAAGSATGFSAFSSEALAASDPDVVLVLQTRGEDKQRVMSHPALSKLRAVRQRQVYTVDADILSRAGPRLAQAVQIVARILRESSASEPHTASRSTSLR